MAATKISPSEAWNRLRKARRMAHHARKQNISAEEIATSEEARRAVLAYSGYLEKGAGASLETWRVVIALMVEDDERNMS